MKPFILIQVLRGVAAMMVVLHHAMTPAVGIPVTQDGFHFGGAGVDIFFVISGFIIYTSTAHREQSPTSFFLRRLIRVFPPYWVVTILLIMTHIFLGMQRDLVLSPDHTLLSFLLIPHESPSSPGNAYPLLIPGWTLQYEVFFYTLFSLALIFPRKSQVLAISVTIAVLVTLGVFFDVSGTGLVPSMWATYTSPLLWEFLAGVLIGVFTSKYSQILDPKLLWGAPLGFCLLVLSDSTDLPRLLEWGLPAIIIVFSTVAGERVTKQAKIPRQLILIGDASYSIYLTHIITLGFVRGVFRAVFTTGQWWIILFIATCLFASLVGGFIFYYIVERPLVKRLTAAVSRRDISQKDVVTS